MHYRYQHSLLLKKNEFLVWYILFTNIKVGNFIEVLQSAIRGQYQFFSACSDGVQLRAYFLKNLSMVLSFFAFNPLLPLA